MLQRDNFFGGTPSEHLQECPHRGVGFTMSLFLGMLAFDDPYLQDRVKLGVIMGSVLAGIGGYALLRFGRSQPRRASRG